jgi:hypothetical protein
MPTKHRLIITVSVILLVVLIVGAVTKAQQPYTQVILNLLNGQQYFGVPHMYQGDNDGSPTNQWPAYYGPSNASQYWGSTSINQPVLELVMLHEDSAGAMFWSETYIGGPVKITIIGTYSNSPLVVNGYEIYLFLTPTMWGISPNYNYSIPYNSTAGEGWLTYTPSYPSPFEGDVILPQSSTPYIEVQWEPVWSDRPWNVWIVNNPNGNNPSVSPSPSPNRGWPYAGWDGIGTGAFYPNPGDRINITVTYDPSTNTLSGVAVDLNTGQSASFTLNLGNYYKPPGSGSYVFGVGASTGSFSYTNWALLYVAMTTGVSTSSVTTPTSSTNTTSTTVTTPTTTSTSTSSTSTSTKPTLGAVPTWVVVVVVIVAVVLIVAILMIKRRKQ